MSIASEDIPNADLLYRWVHKDMYEDKILNTIVFSNLGTGMSTEWSKYSTPDETKNRVKTFKKNPDEYGVLKLNVGKVREIENQIVTHTPSKKNIAHTDVFGEKTPKVRILFSRVYSWVIEIPD